MANKICPICGGEITNPTSNNQIYCSEGCRRKSYGQKNADRIKYQVNGVAPIKYSLIAAYHGECAICGWKIGSLLLANNQGKIETAYGNGLHHIIPVRKGGKNEPDNLILLCPNHHKQADAGLITADELRRHQKPVPLPKETVKKDVAAIEKAVEEYERFVNEHGDNCGITPECIRFLAATDLAVMLGNAKLINGYMHRGIKDELFSAQYISVSEVKEYVESMAKKIAKNDKKSNEYPIRERTFYDICLDIK